MDSSIEFANLVQLTGGHIAQIAISVSVLAVYFAIDRIITPRIEEGAENGNFKAGVVAKATRIARMIMAFVGLTILTLVWGIDFQSVFIFASTTLTVLAVALVASWSLLSNVTAHFVLLLDPQFKRGTFVRIIDGENYIEGYISKVNIFNTKIVSENRELIACPNNLFLTRPVVISPRVRLNGVGKIPEPVMDESDQEDSI